MVTLYDEVDQGMVLGSYQDQFVLQFEHLGKEISYEGVSKDGVIGISILLL